MYGQAGQVLYVGKSTNLRKRLFPYRRARAGNGRAKVRKLVRLEDLPVGPFLSGTSLKLIKRMVSVVSQRGLLETFLGRLILTDLEALRSLYDQCLQRNQQIKQILGITERLIPQLKLDDYIIRAAFAGQ